MNILEQGIIYYWLPPPPILNPDSTAQCELVLRFQPEINALENTERALSILIAANMDGRCVGQTRDIPQGVHTW